MHNSRLPMRMPRKWAEDKVGLHGNANLFLVPAKASVGFLLFFFAALEVTDCHHRKVTVNKLTK